MGIKVLECQPTSSAVYVEKDFGSPLASWWIQFDFWIPTATFTALAPGFTHFTPDLLLVADSDDGFLISASSTGSGDFSASPPYYYATENASTPYAGGFTPDAWHTAKAHWNGTTITWWVDGSQIYSYALGGANLDNLRLGATDSFRAGTTYYFDNLKVGTADGLGDVFCADFESGSLSNFDDTAGPPTIVDDPLSTGGPSGGCTSPPPPPATGISGVYIAFGSATLTGSPDYQPVVEVQDWNTDRGRQYELDKTQAGTATVTVFDQNGTYDPTNPNGPWYGQIGPLAPAQIRSVNPVTHVTEPVFTGFVESWNYVLDITERWYILTINLSDGFELLARAEVVPDASGTTILVADLVDDRIQGILTDYGWPSDQELIFSGNVHLQETVYNPQTSLLSVLQDCADAELPNVANLYMDKWGQVAFRGRFSRLIPDFYGPRIGGMTPPAGHQAINTWECGDRNAAETFGIAPIAAVEWTLDLKNVINAVVATPNGISQAAIENQLVDNAVSIAQYGTRVLSISDLLTLDQVADPAQGQLALDANDACMIFGQYYVDNYAQPVEMLSHIEFHTRGVSDSLAAPLWAFICGVEIGDVVKVWTTNPGGGGFRATEFFVEGIHNAIKPLEGGLFDWTQTLDMTPRAWYSVFNGITYYVPPAPPPGLVTAFNATPVIGPASLHVSFNDLSEPGVSGPITAWAWDFGDTGTSTSQNPSHTFTAAGTYTVTLTVTGTSPDGTSSRSQTITVR